MIRRAFLGLVAGLGIAFNAKPVVRAAADAAVSAGTDGPFLLAVSRFVPYKRLDLAIGAAAASTASSS